MKFFKVLLKCGKILLILIAFKRDWVTKTVVAISDSPSIVNRTVCEIYRVTAEHTPSTRPLPHDCTPHYCTTALLPLSGLSQSSVLGARHLHVNISVWVTERLVAIQILMIVVSKHVSFSCDGVWRRARHKLSWHNSQSAQFLKITLSTK